MARIVGFKSVQEFTEGGDAVWATIVFNYEHLKKARQKARELVSSGDSIYEYASIWLLNPDTNERKLIENVYEGKRFATVLEEAA